MLTWLSQGCGDSELQKSRPLIACEVAAISSKIDLEMLSELTRALVRRGVVEISYRSFSSGLTTREAVFLALVDKDSAGTSVPSIDGQRGFVISSWRVSAIQRSGSSMLGRVRMSKVGPARIRAVLYMAAVVGTRYNPHVKADYERLLARGKSKMTHCNDSQLRPLALCMQGLPLGYRSVSMLHRLRIRC